MEKAKTLTGYLTSLLTLATFTIIDYFTMGPVLFTKGVLFSKNIATFSLYAFTFTAFSSQILIAVFSSIKSGLVASIIYEAKITTSTIAEECFNVLNVDGMIKDEPSFLFNVYLCVMVSTLLFAVISFFVWYFKLGKTLKNLPSQPIIGAMIAIGVSIMMCVYKSYDLEKDEDKYYFTTAAVLGGIIYILERFFVSFKFFLPVVSFILIAFLNLFFRFFMKKDTAKMIAENIIFDIATDDSNRLNLLSILKDSNISFTCLYKNISNIFSLAITNAIYINMNVPTYTLAVNDFNINYDSEWFAQFISNIATALTGFPSYFVGSTSILFYRTGGSSRIHSILASGVPIIIFFIGPFIRNYVPNLFSSIILFYVGISFVVENIISIYHKVSAIDLYIVLMTAVLSILINSVGGFFFGVSISILIVLSNFKYLKKEANKVCNDDADVINVDYTLSFATIPELRKCIESRSEGPITLDLSDCYYIDMASNLYLCSLAEAGRSLTIYGKPNNFSDFALKKFENVKLMTTTS